MKMRILLLFFLIPCLGISQSVDQYNFFKLLYYRGYPTHSRKNITLEGQYDGILVFDRDTLRGAVSLKNSYLHLKDEKFDLYDKNLNFFELRQNQKKLKVERLSFDKKLKRVLIDTNGFKAYDVNFLFDFKQISRNDLYFEYNSKVFRVKNSIFRKFDKDLEKAIARLKLQDKNLEKYIYDFFSQT